MKQNHNRRQHRVALGLFCVFSLFETESYAAPAEIASRTANVGGVQLHYLTAGKGQLFFFFTVTRKLRACGAPGRISHDQSSSFPVAPSRYVLMESAFTAEVEPPPLTNRGCEYHFLGASGPGEAVGLVAASRTVVPVVRESEGLTITLSDSETPLRISD